MNNNNLNSEKGVNYSKLRELLEAGKWKKADYETYLVMLQAVGREEGSWIRPDEMKNFPSTDLLTINGLWLKYSDGKFGFSVQKQIYESIYSVSPGIESSDEFIERVGWQVDNYNQLTFDLQKALKGHLPGCWAFRFFGFGWYLLSRKELMNASQIPSQSSIFKPSNSFWV